MVENKYVNQINSMCWIGELLLCIAWPFNFILLHSHFFYVVEEFVTWTSRVTKLKNKSLTPPNELDPIPNPSAKCLPFATSLSREIDVYVLPSSDVDFVPSPQILKMGYMNIAGFLKTQDQHKPNLLIVNGGMQYASSPHLNVYVPDLVFVWESIRTPPEWSDSFQA